MKCARQSGLPEEVSRVVREGEQLQVHLIVPEVMAGYPQQTQEKQAIGPTRVASDATTLFWRTIGAIPVSKIAGRSADKEGGLPSLPVTLQYPLCTYAGDWGKGSGSCAVQELCAWGVTQNQD